MKIVDIKENLSNIEVTVAFDKKAIEEFKKDILFKDYKKSKVFDAFKYEKVFKFIVRDFQLGLSLKGKEINLLTYISKRMFFQPELKKYIDDIFEFLPIQVTNEFVSDSSFNVKLTYAKFTEVKIKGTDFLVNNETIKKSLENKYDKNDPKLILQCLKPYLKPNVKQIASMGDELNIDIKIFENNKEIKEFAKKGFKFILGKSPFFKEFDLQLKNAKVNETKEFEVDYKLVNKHPIFENKKIRFNVVITSIGEYVLPKKIDDAFIKSLKIQDVKNLNDYDKFIENFINKKIHHNYMQAFSAVMLTYGTKVFTKGTPIDKDLLKLEFFSVMDDIELQENKKMLFQAMIVQSMVERSFIIHELNKKLHLKITNQDIEKELKRNKEFEKLKLNDVYEDSLIYYTFLGFLLDIKFIEYIQEQVLNSKNVEPKKENKKTKNKKDKPKDISKLN